MKIYKKHQEIRNIQGTSGNWKYTRNKNKNKKIKIYKKRQEIKNTQETFKKWKIYEKRQEIKSNEKRQEIKNIQETSRNNIQAEDQGMVNGHDIWWPAAKRDNEGK